MAETIHAVLDRIETRQGPNPTRLQSENVEIGPNDISLDLLQAVYRNNQLPLTTRMRAALGAIQFESPKLAVVAQVTENDIATVLDRRIARYQQMKLLESKPVSEDELVSDRTIIEEPKPPPPTPAPLNRLYNKRLYRRI